MRAGKATRVLIDRRYGKELVVELQEDSHGMVQRILKIIIKIYYVFRNTSQIPGNILMNTYLGYPSNSGNIPAFFRPRRK